jgi:FkbM family methyltransferase
MKKFKSTLLNSIRVLFKNPFFENLLVFAMKKTSGNFFISKLIPNHYQYKKNTIRQASINGITLSLDISEYLSHFLYFGYKDISMKELVNLSKNKNYILDAGANIGYTGLLMAYANNFRSSVYLFEPDPVNYKKLLRNLKLNHTNNIFPMNLGFGRVDSREKLAISQNGNLGENFINTEATDNFNWIEMTSIDKFCSSNNLNKIDLIKIDVEGYERNVLVGAEKTIARDKPSIYIEIIDEKLKAQGSSAKEVVAFLENYYSIIYNANSKEKVSSKDNFEKKEIDIIATP